MDTDSENSSIYSYSSESEEVKQKKIIKKSSKPLTKVKLPTVGKKANDMIIKKNKLYAKMCEYCGLYYDNRMVTKGELGDSICQHCYFFFNFDNPEPKYGWTLEEYSILCGPEHNISSCPKFQNSGTCHLCLYLLDLESIKKKEPEKKIKQEKEDANIRKINFSSKSGKKVDLCNNDIIFI